MGSLMQTQANEFDKRIIYLVPAELHAEQTKSRFCGINFQNLALNIHDTFIMVMIEMRV